MKKRYEINMTKGPLLPELLQFILPLMLSSMLQIAFNAADLIVVGRFGRPHSMAAVGANGAMINLIINVLMGLATGGGVLCARYYGANQTDKLHRTVSTTLITGVIVAIPTAWSDEYQNITVNMVAGGLEDYVIQCFRLTGEGAKDLKEGDEITVTGILKNYKGTVEFDKGCTLQ